MPDSGIQIFDPSDYFVLIVDDVPKNLQLVGTVLRNDGYRVSAAGSGKEALERLENMKADLILLDLMMPEMDGLEVCRCLKENPKSADIPIVFVTASSELTHLLTAFELGAMDYVTKPFYPPELLARVKTQIELKYSREALMRANERLKELNEEKNEFMGIASHDLKSPLTSILGIAQLIQSNLSMSHEDIIKWVTKVEQQSQRMIYIIKNLLDANRLDRGEMRMNTSEVNLVSIVGEIVSQMEQNVGYKQQTLELQNDCDRLIIRADQNLMLQVLENLVSNAVKYSPRKKLIRVRTYSEFGKAIMEVRDEGPGLSIEDQAKLFKRFARLTPEPTGGEHSSGLGLSIARRLVEGMGGEIWYKSKLGEGSTFGVTFKRINSE